MLHFSVDVHKQKPEIIITYDGESIQFCASVFQRRSFEVLDVFEPANTFLSRLSAQEHQALWKIYRSVYDGFDTIYSTDQLQKHLTSMARELVELIPLHRIESWVTIDPGFIIPPEIQSTFVQDEERKNSPGKTYLRSDYVKLISLSIFTRFLMPIIGEFIETTRQNIGVDFKEYEALKLLNGTGLLESDPMVKLTEYIDHVTKEKHRNPERILSGISSEDMSFYLLSLTVVRRLSVSDVRGIMPKPNLAAKVYNFLFQKVFNPTKTDMPIREKTFNDGKGEGDQNKRSMLESYRKRVDISIGDLAGVEYGYEDFYKTVLRLAPDLPEAVLEQSLETSKELSTQRIGDPQVMLMAWVFKHVHSPSTPLYIRKKLLGANLGVLEAVLWHWGFKYLSILATSHVLRGEDTMYIAPMDNRGQIADEYKTKILELYPHTWSNTRRNYQGVTEEPNPVLYAIDLCVDGFVGSAWWATASDEKLKEVFGEVRRRTPIFPHIKTELAKLIVFIEEKYNSTPPPATFV